MLLCFLVVFGHGQDLLWCPVSLPPESKRRPPFRTAGASYAEVTAFQRAANQALAIHKA